MCFRICISKEKRGTLQYTKRAVQYIYIFFSRYNTFALQKILIKNRQLNMKQFFKYIFRTPISKDKCLNSNEIIVIT